MAEGVLNQDEAVTTFNVVRYIRMRETYDPKALKENFEIAQLSRPAMPRAKLTEIYSPATRTTRSGPRSQYGCRGDDQIRDLPQ